MGNVVTFYKSHKSSNRSLQVTDTDKAILDLRIVRKRLVTCKEQQETLCARSHETAAELVKKNLRDRALTALKKKKLHERQALQLEQNILKIDEQTIALETTEQQVDTVSALKAANFAMKAMQQQMPLDSIEKLMEENEEASEYVEQVNSMLSKRMGDAVDVDDELAALEAEMADEEAADMPQVPTGTVEVQNMASAAEPSDVVETSDIAEQSEVQDMPTAPDHEAVKAEIGEQEATLVAA